MDGFEINSRRFTVVRSLSRNRNAWARLRGDTLTITIPSRWPEAEKKRIGDGLLRKAMRAIEKGKWTGEGPGRVAFGHGQRVQAMGREFEIVFIPGKRFGARMQDNRLVVKVNESHPKKAEKASAIARNRIVDALMPELSERVKRINLAHFNAAIKRIRVRDNITRWGSCSRDGSVSLNLRLLFMPEHILDYVIVHELAHTRYRSHGKRFWALVGSVMPDHLERRKWLRENGWSYPKDNTDLIYEEPY